MFSEECLYRVIGDALDSLRLTEVARNNVLTSILTSERIQDAVIKDESETKPEVNKIIDESAGIVSSDCEMDVGVFAKINSALGNFDSGCEANNKLSTNTTSRNKKRHRFFRRGVFRVRVNTGGMTFTLLKEIEGLQFIVWRDGKRQESVQIFCTVHTCNIGSEGIIFDGGQLANSFYLTSTYFRFAQRICEGVLGDLTEDNLVTGEIENCFSFPSRNAHPFCLLYTDMFPNYSS